MPRRLFLLLVCATLLAAQHTDAPRRIISTAPSITEMLYALGLGDRVVADTRFCRYPPEARLKPKIGDYVNPNLEAIAALKPDLVIVQTNPVHLRERLTRMHLNTIEVDQQNIAAIYDSIRQVGDAAGVPGRAATLIASIRAGLDRIRARAAAFKPVRMMFVIGRSQGRLDGLVVVGRASFLNQVIRVAGGENIFNDAVAPYPGVSLEEVIARDPEVILDMGDMADTVAVTDRHKREVVALWNRVPSVAAVKRHHVYAIAADMYMVPGPRVVDSARSIFDMLHPESQ
jgi:iron complex transport system substrate-binding protein